MSITKFAKHILVSSDSKEQLEKLTTAEQNLAKTYIKNVIRRLTDLGFKEFLMMADYSLNEIAYKEITNRNANAKAIVPFTEELGRLLDDYEIIIQPNNNLYGNRVRPPMSDELIEKYKEEIEFLYNEEFDLYSTISGEEKLKRIEHYTLLRMMGIPVHDSRYKYNNNQYISLLNFYLVKSGTTLEDFHRTLKSDLERRWKEFYEEETFGIPNPRFKRKAVKEVKKEEPQPEEEKAFTEEDLMKIMMGEEASISDNVIEVDFNRTTERELNPQMTIEYSETPQKVREVVANDFGEMEGKSYIVALSYARELMTLDELVQHERYMEQVKKLKAVSRKYVDEMLKNLIYESKIIVDFTLVTTERRHKLIPYKDIESNTIILNVDLRTGTVHSYFNGGEFNIKPFFKSDERTQLNAKEW